VLLRRVVVETSAGEGSNVECPDQPVVDDVAGHGREGRAGAAAGITEQQAQ
jgi:hypothetical protein